MVKDTYNIKEVLRRHECYTEALMRALNSSLEDSVGRYLKEDNERYKAFATEAVCCLQTALMNAERYEVPLESSITGLINSYNKIIGEVNGKV